MTEVTPVTPPPPPPRKSRAGTFFLGAFSGCLIGLFIFTFFGIFIAAMTNQTGSTDFSIGNKVAVIPIEGEIFEARETLDKLHQYADAFNVKAIVMRINSPGGAVAPSQEIYEEILKVRKSSGKPIVASVDSVGASGAYYIASACDQIIANPGSITGSIGVILQWMEVKDLVAWAKLKPQTIRSGDMKDVGSPYRDPTPAELAYLQGLTSELHQQFIRAVFEGRKGRISEADLTRLADGRVFTGEQAVALKLVDRLGNLDDAVNVAAKLAHIPGKPSILYPKKRMHTLFDLLNTNDTKSLIDSVNRRAAFLYRW